MSEPHHKDSGSCATGMVYIEPSIRTIAGVLIMALCALIYFTDQYLIAGLAALLFIGFNLFQSGFSGFCLMERLLKILGFKSELDEIRALSKEVQKISDQQAEYLETLTLLNEAVIELSIDGCILSVSEGWLHITGEANCYSAVGQPLANYLLTGDHERFSNLLEVLVYEDRPNRHVDFRLFIKDEGTKWVSANFMLVQHEAGCSIKGVLTDISESKQLVHERRVFQQELTHARRLSNLGEMAAGLAHELNQPLAAINLYMQGCMKRLETRPDNLDEIREVMELVSTQARRAGDIIKQMRGFVRKTPLNKSAVNIHELIKESLQLMEGDPVMQDVSFQFEMESRLPVISVDNLQIQQVVINLVSNAVEAMDDIDAKKRITIRTKLFDDKIRIDVIDRGKGVPENIESKLFDPFTTGRKDGLGLGLAISRSIIEEHGGSIYYENLDEGGICFSFTLPLNNKIND